MAGLGLRQRAARHRGGRARGPGEPGGPPRRGPQRLLPGHGALLAAGAAARPGALRARRDPACFVPRSPSARDRGAHPVSQAPGPRAPAATAAVSLVQPARAAGRGDGGLREPRLQLDLRLPAPLRAGLGPRGQPRRGSTCSSRSASSPGGYPARPVRSDRARPGDRARRGAHHAELPAPRPAAHGCRRWPRPRSCSGPAWPCSIRPCSRSLVDRTPEAERGSAMGTLSGSFDLGSVLGSLTGRLHGGARLLRGGLPHRARRARWRGLTLFVRGRRRGRVALLRRPTPGV